MSIYVPPSFSRFVFFRRNLHEKIEPYIQNMNPFWYSCFPNLLIQRLNEYGSGFCCLILAYERYILVCKPSEKELFLSSSKRKLKYSLVTIATIVLFTGDAASRYVTRDYMCNAAPPFYGRVNFLIRGITSGFLTFVFLLLPTSISVCYYYYVIKQLLELKQSKKVGRNQNLAIVFGLSSLTWILGVTTKLLYQLYYFFVITRVPLYDVYKYPMMHSFQLQLFSFSASFASILSPLMLIIVLKSYRKPVEKSMENLRIKLNTKLKKNDP